MIVWGLGRAMMLLGILEKGVRTSERSLMSVYLICTIWVTILPAWGMLLVLVLRSPPSWPARSCVTTFANLSPIGTMVMAVMPRNISKAAMASVRFRGVWDFRVIVASFGTDPGPVLARKMVRPTKSAYMSNNCSTGMPGKL